MPAEKFIHISDTHLTGVGEKLFGMNSDSNFIKCVDHIYENHLDAKGIIVTGDIANSGSIAAYRLMAKTLKTLPFKTYYLVGNHDSKLDAIRELGIDYSEVPGHVQYKKHVQHGLFIFLDSVKENESAGEFCKIRYQWLRTTLSLARERNENVFIFMHHNPFKINVKCSDKIGLAEPAVFKDILDMYRRNIRYIFFGHCHQTLSGSFYGIPFSSLKSTNHQIFPNFKGDERFHICDYEPSYNVIHFDDHSVSIHSIEFRKSIVAIV